MAFTSFGIPSSVFKSAAGPPRAASESSPRSRGPSADPDAANLHNARLASADSSDAFRPSLQPSRGGSGCQLRRAAANDKGRQGEGRRAYLNRRISTKDFANLRSPKSRWARTATDRPAPGTSAIAARQSWRGSHQRRPESTPFLTSFFGFFKSAPVRTIGFRPAGHPSTAHDPRPTGAHMGQP